MNIRCDNCSVESCIIKKYCSEQSIKTIEQSKSIVRNKKGQYIFREGDRVQGIYFIHSGKVKVLSTGFNNKKQIIRFAKAGHLLGHRGLWSKFYWISAVAIEDSTLCFIEENIFTQLLKSNPEFTYQLMFFYVEELRLAETRIKNLAQMTVLEKAVEALLLIKKTFGLPTKDKEILLDIVLSRKDIAELAGLSSGQITRCFFELKKERKIRMDGKKIIFLQPETLYNLISPYYLSNIFRECYLLN